MTLLVVSWPPSSISSVPLLLVPPTLKNAPVSDTVPPLMTRLPLPPEMPPTWLPCVVPPLVTTRPSRPTVNVPTPAPPTLKPVTVSSAPAPET